MHLAVVPLHTGYTPCEDRGERSADHHCDEPRTPPCIPSGSQTSTPNLIAAHARGAFTAPIRSIHLRARASNLNTRMMMALVSIGVRNGTKNRPPSTCPYKNHSQSKSGAIMHLQLYPPNGDQLRRSGLGQKFIHLCCIQCSQGIPSCIFSSRRCHSSRYRTHDSGNAG